MELRGDVAANAVALRNGSGLMQKNDTNDKASGIRSKVITSALAALLYVLSSKRVRTVSERLRKIRTEYLIYD